MSDDRAAPSRRYRLLGVSSSLRSNAFSTKILYSLTEAMEQHADMAYADIGSIPLYNQDLYVDPLPEAVRRFREQVADADGVVISSPEYNHGIPGPLKNALDWASRPHNGSPFNGKPVLVITSSPAFTGGVRAQYQIREALASMLARPVSTPELVVGLVGSKVHDGRFHDPATIDFARGAFLTMFAEIERLSASDQAG